MKANRKAKQNKIKTRKTKSQRKDIVSYYKKPKNLTTEQWQIALRRQFAEDSSFSITNLGTHKIYSDFKIFNPLNKNSYKVSIRTLDHETGTNFCSCFDYKTNSLGTCKHIEAVLLYIKKQKGFSKFSKEGYEPAYTSIYLKYGIQREIRIKIGSDNKEEFEQLAKKYFDENFVLRKESYNKFENLLEKARTINTSFKCYSDALEYIIDIREANRRELMINNLVSSGEWENYLGNILKVKPFPFQVEGIAFACKAGKTLNADEMGLGKTLQAIGAAEVLKREFHISKVLIICPTSLKYQWKSEIEKFAQSDSIVIEGHALKREAQYSEESFYKIASYNVVGSDIKQINSYSPDLVILDEAQRIKNWKTKVAQNVKKIRSPHTIVLTGTPLENKLEELVSIVQFVDPFKLGPLHRFLEKHQVKDEAGKVIGYKNLNEIGNILSDIMIRRLKAEVLTQLPERSDKNLFVPMTDKQSQLHNEFNDTVARLVNKWRRFGFLNEQDRQRLMINLNRMRMVCDSTYIIDQETRHDTKIDELMCILDKAFQMNGNKVVVFSQWERMTRLVAAELEKRNLKYEYLHGGIASKDRGQLLLNFRENKDSKVFLSTDAGGVGLNLQSASLLINLDIPWNPAVLEQRIGRVYRYGQKQNVSIINFVATGTIEHKMLDVIKFKSSIAQGILDDGEDNVFLGDDKFKEFMKTVDSIVTSESIKQVAEETEQEQEIYLEDRKEKPLVLTTEVSRLLSEDEDTSIEKQKTKETDAAVDKQVAALFTSAIDFVNKLSQTLPDSKSTEKLISSLIERDEKSGKSYIKIPIENEEIVGNAINAFSGFVKMLKGL